MLDTRDIKINCVNKLTNQPLIQNQGDNIDQNDSIGIPDILRSFGHKPQLRANYKWSKSYILDILIANVYNDVNNLYLIEKIYIFGSTLSNYFIINISTSLTLPIVDYTYNYLH